MKKNIHFLRRIVAKLAIFLFILNFTTLCNAQSGDSSESSVIVGSDALLSSGGAVIVDYTTKDNTVVVHVSREKISKSRRKAANIITEREEAPNKVHYIKVKPNVVFYTKNNSQEVNRINAHWSATTVVPHFKINFVALVEAVPLFIPYLYNTRELVFFNNVVFLDDHRRILFFTRPPPALVG